MTKWNTETQRWEDDVNVAPATTEFKPTDPHIGDVQSASWPLDMSMPSPNRSWLLAERLTSPSTRRR